MVKQQAPKIRIDGQVVAIVGRSWQRPNQKIQPLPGGASPKSHCSVKKDVPFSEEAAEIIKLFLPFKVHDIYQVAQIDF